MLKKFASQVLFVFTLLGLSSYAAAEESLYSRLGGSYNIASTVDHLVDLIYINKGLNANPSTKSSS